MMENVGWAQGCSIDDITITNADLNFGAATQAGPTAYLTDVSNVTLSGVTLRGRRQGQFLRAVRCKGLFRPGRGLAHHSGLLHDRSGPAGGVQHHNISLVVRSASSAPGLADGVQQRRGHDHPLYRHYRRMTLA